MEFKDEDFRDIDSFILTAGQKQVNRTTTGKEAPLKTTASESPPRETLTVVGISDAAMGSQAFMPQDAVSDLYNRVGQDVLATGIAENGGPQVVFGGALAFAPTDVILKAENAVVSNDYTKSMLTGGTAATAPQPIDPGGAQVGPGGWAKPFDGKVTSGFGPRRSPTAGASSNHKGLDIDGNSGDPIRASKGGRVTKAGGGSGYGTVVYIDHGGGWESRYAHLSGLNVAVGAEVLMNQVIGKMGMTGTATGVHLHFEIRQNGTAVDPSPLVGMSK